MTSKCDFLMHKLTKCNKFLKCLTNFCSGKSGMMIKLRLLHCYYTCHIDKHAEWNFKTYYLIFLLKIFLELFNIFSLLGKKVKVSMDNF